jgi:hypothetical protein
VIRELGAIPQSNHPITKSPDYPILVYWGFVQRLYFKM